MREIIQDTVIGLQALAKLAEKLSKDTSSVEITYKYGEGEGQGGYMNIRSDNSIILQKKMVSLNELFHVYYT